MSSHNNSPLRIKDNLPPAIHQSVGGESDDSRRLPKLSKRATQMEILNNIRRRKQGIEY